MGYFFGAVNCAVISFVPNFHDLYFLSLTTGPASVSSVALILFEGAMWFWGRGCKGNPEVEKHNVWFTLLYTYPDSPNPFLLLLFPTSEQSSLPERVDFIHCW